MKELNEIVIENIKKMLASAKRRPAWLAAETGMANGQISTLLAGKAGSNPSINTLGKIAKALGCSIDELCQDGEIKPKESYDDYIKKIGELTMEVARLQALLSASQAKAPQTAAEAETRAQRVIEKSRAARLQAPKAEKKS